MKVNYEVSNNMVWCQVGKIDVESNYDELVASGKYETEWLDECSTIYVPKNDKIPYIAYHFYSGTIRVIGAELDICTDCFDVVGHLLTYGNLNELYTFNK